MLEISLISPSSRFISSNALIAESLIESAVSEDAATSSPVAERLVILSIIKEAAKMIGEAVAKRALDKGITEVVFDRGGYVYHGRVQTLAESAREAGLKF